MNKSLEALNCLDAGWFSYKRKLDLLEASKGLFTIFALPENSLKSLSDLTTYIPQVKKFEDLILSVNSSEKKIDQDILVFSTEGKYIWISLHLQFLGGEDDEVLGVIQDISERKKLSLEKNELIDQQFHFKETLGSVAVIAETDIRGTITAVNQKFCDVTGYSSEELIGKNHRILNSGFHSKEFFKKLWKTIVKGDVWNGRVCNKAKNGEYYWVETHIAAIYRQEKIKGYFAIRFVITDQVRLQEKLKQEEEKSRFNEQLAAIGEMSASIAHEIANPLAVIHGSNNLLMKQLDKKEKIIKYSEAIRKSVDRIQKIVVGLKRLSRKPQNNDMELVSLYSIMTETLGFCQESLRNGNIEIHMTEIPKDLLILCREVEISQVLLNLVNNARDAILEAESDESRWIKIHTGITSEKIYVQVVDSGPGIPGGLRAKVMNSFFTTKKAGKGTGLGLSLVKRIIESHGGTLSLLDNTKNTTFEFTIPRVSTTKKTAS